MILIKKLAIAAMVVSLAACATKRANMEDIDFTKRARLVDGPEGARMIFAAELLFDFGQSALKPAAAKNIEDCAFIIDRARGGIIIEGHTDSQGAREINDKLSVDRAESVQTALIDRKIAPSRFEVRGLADTKPLIPNATTDRQHAQNRRAEIVLKGETLSSLDAPDSCGGGS